MFANTDSLKSYVYLLQKWGFEPTIEGPYCHVNKVQQQGKHGIHRMFGGKATTQQVLAKKKHGSTATAGAETGEVPAEDQQNDSEYLCEVEIGTPAQKFLLDFDTGSADLWLWSTELPAATIKSGSSHTIFDPKKSSTFKATKGATWSISYGDSSSASGTVGTDLVNIGGVKIQNQSIELAKTLSSQFASGTGDGLLGLAFGSINTVQPTPVQTPVENMITQVDIPKSAELFTVYLGSWRDTNDADKGESFYTFGYIDQPTITATKSEVYYTPIDNSQGFWSFDSTSASVNGTTIQRSGNTAIADTGMLSLPIYYRYSD